MKIESPAFHNNEPIPVLYTCDGKRTSPPLFFVDTPVAAKSFVLIMEDPDIPRSVRHDGVWDHWLIWNIPAKTDEVEEGKPPTGVYGTNSGGTKKYGPPCPPDREHRYFFKLFALDTVLSLPEGSNKEQLLAAIDGHVLDHAELIGTYDRKK
jgi:hypothetical protein